MTTKNKTVPATTAQPGDQLPVTSSYADYTPADEVLDVEKTFPVLHLLQAGSEALVKASDKFVEGAAAGMLYCRATDTLYDGDTGVIFVPCIREHFIVEQKPFEAGWQRVGGRMSVHDPIWLAAVARSTKFGQYLSEAGNDLVETFLVYGYLLDEAGNADNEIILSITSTKITPYKPFFARIKGFRHKLPDGSRTKGPMFAHRIRITTIGQTHKETGKFSYNYKFSSLNGRMEDSVIPENSPLMKLGESIEKAYKAGNIVADDETNGGDGTTATPAF